MNVNAYRFLWDRLNDPDTAEMIRKALAQGVVLDTWMNGEEHERFSDAAMSLLTGEAARLTAQAVEVQAIFPHYHMPEDYVTSVFHEILFSTALYAAQKRKGQRRVGLPEAREAVGRLRDFIAEEPEDLMAVGGFFFAISTYEDLNAISFYGRMSREDFLHGRLHRPWSNLVLTAQLAAHERMGLVECVFTGQGDMLFLTELGRDVLERLRSTLDEAGEFDWRADNQRWAIFGEMDYDLVFSRVLPDFSQVTRDYLETLGLQPGMRVLEVGCGTGRATVDLGLHEMVGPTGEVVALDPSAVLLKRLEAKCAERGIENVRVVQGVAEELPFPDGSFDAAISVMALHFTDAYRSVAEMARVTKTGGLVSALCPPPEADARVVPMVATWFRPLSDLADRFGLPFSEKNGLPRGVLEKAFQMSLNDTEMRNPPAILSAEDSQSFLVFIMKGAALFQNVLCRLPYRERQEIFERLEREGAILAGECLPEEKRATYHHETAYGRAP